jgi:fumarate hydratase class II
MGMREESDSLGSVLVESKRYWGAQTQRSLQYFEIGSERFTWPFIDALIRIKKAAALANHSLAALDDARCKLIVNACDSLLDDPEQSFQEFPLSVWQTGSGTQTNMNANEVIANRANEIAGAQLGSKSPIHPNDHVNMSQSSNDIFPSAMHLVTIMATRERLLPALTNLSNTLADKQQQFQEIKTVGRTHMMDAVSLTVGEFLSGFVDQLEKARANIACALGALHSLAIGGSAVGNGVNTPPGFAESFCRGLKKEMGMDFDHSGNKFSALSGQDDILGFHASLKQLATVLFKLANDTRFLASGPRCGIGEWLLPENEPGSSIMPGKINPTQCEALSMVAVQVIANDVAVTFASASGHLQLNVYRPLIIYNVMQSIQLLSDSMSSFDQNCLRGLQLNNEKIQTNLQRNLMDITRLVPDLGYDAAANIAKYAHQNNLAIREAATILGFEDQLPKT